MSQSSPQKLMVLGGGLFQTAFIETAVRLGLEVITVDNLPANPGHRLARNYIICSFTDVSGVLEAARRERIDGVAAFASDAALPTAAHIAAKLDIWAPSPAVVETCVRKDRFRQFQSAAGLPCPRFVAGSTWEEVKDDVSVWNCPLIMKPADASGSRGLCCFHSGRDPGCRKGFDLARSHSRCGIVCVEEYLSGRDLTAEGFMIDGRAGLFFLTEKHSQGLVVKGHRAPSDDSPDIVQEAKALVEAHWQALDYADGPFDADLRQSEDRLTVLEMSPRLGGNGVPLIIDRCFSVNLVEAAIRQSLGLSYSLSAPTAPRGTASVNLGLTAPGRIVSFNPPDEVQRRVPALRALYSRLERGMDANAHTHGGNTLAMAIFDCPRAEDYNATTSAIKDALELKTR